MRSDISGLIEEVKQSIDLYEDMYPELHLMQRILIVLKEWED